MSTEEWPGGSVLTEALADPSWRPLPFQDFVLKIHKRCNLACDYCYIYEMADQGWRSGPAIMSRRTIDQAARRMADHARSHRLSRVTVVLHGGEPLLAGADLISHTARTLRDAAEGVTVDLTVQTNGVLLDDRMLATLREHRVRVSVSLDGGAAENDRHRRYRNGKGSHAATAAGLTRLTGGPNRPLFAGLLCTVDLANDPVQVYTDLLEFEPPQIDFLLPHGNWTRPPPELGADGSATPYGDWLVAVFDRWYDAPRRETGVRKFQEIMNLLLGGMSRAESVGLSPARLIVIDTDGSLEQVDTLKSAFDNAATTGYDVLSGSFDRAMSHPAIVARQRGMAGLCHGCRQCAVVSVCGGGYYPHRYRAGAGFLNPSVYCHDLQRLIIHIRGRMITDLDRFRESRPAET